LIGSVETCFWKQSSREWLKTVRAHASKVIATGFANIKLSKTKSRT
jgi:hypothetical protein